MQYKIEFRPRAHKFLNEMPKGDKERVLQRIQEISHDPRHDNVIKMAGKDEKYRARQGNYRIVFSIHDELLIVEIIDIDHRKDAYKK